MVHHDRSDGRYNARFFAPERSQIPAAQSPDPIGMDAITRRGQDRSHGIGRGFKRDSRVRIPVGEVCLVLFKTGIKTQE